MKLVLEVLGGFVGGIAGLIAGVSTLMFLRELFFGDIALLFAPIAGIVGWFCGFLTGRRLIRNRPKVFWAILLPTAALLVSPFLLRMVDRPHLYSFHIEGTNGAEFMGFIDVDGQRQRLRHSIPASFDFRARRIEYAVALVNQNGEQEMMVKITSGGSSVYGDGASNVTTGAHHILRSSGFSEDFGGTSHLWSRLSSEEAQELLTTGDLKLKFRLGPKDF